MLFDENDGDTPNPEFNEVFSIRLHTALDKARPSSDSNARCAVLVLVLQSVVFEVWDSDAVSRDEAMGQAWRCYCTAPWAAKQT